MYNIVFLGDFGEHSSLFRSYLPHLNLEWCTVFFFLVSLFFRENSIKFHNFPQPNGLVGIWFNQLVGIACVERIFFVILESKSYMVPAHKLQLDHGQYCGSILGLGLSYMQPTMNPYGYLVVKQAENLRYSACMENKERS